MPAAVVGDVVVLSPFSIGVSLPTPTILGGDVLGISSFSVGVGLQTPLIVSGDSIALSVFEAMVTIVAPALTGPAFVDPTSIVGLKEWHDALDEDASFQDAARTVPAVSNGDPVGGVVDESGIGWHLGQTTDAKRPLLELVTVNGYPGRCWHFDGVNDFLANALTLPQPNTIMLVARVRALSGAQAIIDSSAAGYNNLYANTGVTTGYAGKIGATTTRDGDWCVFRITFNGASSKIGIDARTPVTVDLGTQARSALTIAATLAGGAPLEIWASELVVYDHALTDEDVTNLLAYFRARHSFLKPLSGKQAACVGGSVTQGYGLVDSVTQSWPVLVSNMHPGEVRWRNFGFAGQQLTAMEAQAAEQIDTQYGGLYTKNLVIVKGGSNDFAIGGVNAATAYARLKTFVTSRKSVGWDVLPITMLPRTGYETQRQAFRALIEDGYATGDLPCLDPLIVDTACPLIGAPGANTDRTYYQADHIHLNAAGHVVLAGAINTSLSAAGFWATVGRRWPWQQRRHRRMLMGVR